MVTYYFTPWYKSQNRSLNTSCDPQHKIIIVFKYVICYKSAFNINLISVYCNRVLYQVLFQLCFPLVDIVYIELNYLSPFLGHIQWPNYLCSICCQPGKYHIEYFLGNELRILYLYIGGRDSFIKNIKLYPYIEF